MAVQYSISTENEYLRLDLSGFYTPGNETSEARELWGKVADECRIHKLRRVLACSSMTGEIPAIVSYEIASEPETFRWERSFRVALVFVHKERYESHLFAETVMVNRYYDMKAFLNEDEAKTWLLRP